MKEMWAGFTNGIRVHYWHSYLSHQCLVGKVWGLKQSVHAKNSVRDTTERFSQAGSWRGDMQISEAIIWTLTKLNNDQFISDHWSSTMPAYQLHRHPLTSMSQSTVDPHSPPAPLAPVTSKLRQPCSSPMVLAGHPVKKTGQVSPRTVCVRVSVLGSGLVCLAEKAQPTNKSN